MITHGTTIKIFAGNSNPELAQKIADHVESLWGPCDNF